MFPRHICSVIETSNPNDRNDSLMSIFVIKNEITPPPKLPSTVTIISMDAQLPALPYVISALCSDLSSRKDNIAITPKWHININANKRSRCLVGGLDIGTSPSLLMAPDDDDDTFSDILLSCISSPSSISSCNDKDMSPLISCSDDDDDGGDGDGDAMSMSLVET
jgi:hypothetical protein